jgi:hypothetical protein
MKKQFITTFATIFVLLTIGLYLLQHLIPAYCFAVLETGNVIMFVLSMVACFLVNSQIGRPGGAFMRGVSGASFLKLIVCMVAVLIYVVTQRATLHKPSIFVLFGIYAIYTTSETLLLSKLARTVK